MVSYLDFEVPYCHLLTKYWCSNFSIFMTFVFLPMVSHLDCLVDRVKNVTTLKFCPREIDVSILRVCQFILHSFQRFHYRQKVTLSVNSQSLAPIYSRQRPHESYLNLLLEWNLPSKRANVSMITLSIYTQTFT